MGKLDKIIEKHKEGVKINLFVTPGSKKCIFPAGLNKWRNKIEIKVTSPPKGNQANFDVIKTIAKFFDMPVKNVWILSGKNSKEKTILVKKITINSVIKRLEESLNGL